MVAKGKKSSASFDFTAVNAFNLFFPDKDWNSLEKRMGKTSAKALENMRQQMINCRGGKGSQGMSEREGNPTKYMITNVLVRGEATIWSTKIIMYHLITNNYSGS